MGFLKLPSFALVLAIFWLPLAEPVHLALHHTGHSGAHSHDQVLDGPAEKPYNRTIKSDDHRLELCALYHNLSPQASFNNIAPFQNPGFQKPVLIVNYLISWFSSGITTRHIRGPPLFA